jgi:radical SAM superfamily enzyme
MMESSGVISDLAIDTIKFHQLQIVKGTRMEEEFAGHREDFHMFNLDSYIDFIISFIERLNPAFCIERFTGEMPPRFLAGYNLGLLRNDEVLRKIEEELERRDSWQGKIWRPLQNFN